MIQVKIKKLHENAIVPKYAKCGDAGLDLTATSKSYDYHGNTVYGVGLAFEIPEGYVGLLFPRSSNSQKNLSLTNSVGVLDSSYRGEVMLKFRNNSVENLPPSMINSLVLGDLELNQEYSVGDRVGQIIILPYPQVSFEEVDELSITERGESGYGSTGK
jgi:dUTP pyrophosphatase